MESKLSLFLYFLCIFNRLHLTCSAPGQETSFESVPDLEKIMYTEIEGYPCVRLLNVSGEIGCSNPGRERVVAPIVRFNSKNMLVGSATMLVSPDEFETFVSRISEDHDFSKKVAGVLLESRTQDQNLVKGNSPDVKFPQAQFAPYRSENFEWNPTGSGIMWRTYNFPIFLLSETSTAILQEAVNSNEKSQKTHTKDVAEFDLVMQTTKSGTHNSESCLSEGTCLPLGGYSVWSMLPPINSSPPKFKPIVLAMTSMDSASFFRDKSLGADSPISGLITLLAAVDALSRLGVDKLNKQLAFVVFTGEAWGYLGSRRFLLEYDRHSDSTEGLNLTVVDTVMEIGSVGRSFSQGVNTLFAHAAGETSSVNATLDALRLAQDSLKTENIVVKTARSSNPGVPPSSLMTFLRKVSKSIFYEDFAKWVAGL